MTIKYPFIPIVLLGLMIHPLMAQNVNATLQEKFPQTRDPSYKPPVLPQGVGISSEASGALMLFTPGEGGLSEYMKNRQKTELEQRRKNSRYIERENERMLERGYYRELLGKQAAEQLGQDGFAPDTGSYPYQESPTRRFSIISLLAWPITAGFSFGVIRLTKLSANDSGGFTNDESILGSLMSVILALAVGIYDHHQVSAWIHSGDKMDAWPPELRIREGLRPDDFSHLMDVEPSKNELGIGSHQSKIFAFKLKF